MATPSTVMASTATAFWLASPGEGELRETAIEAPKSGEVRVKALYSGISRGTESLVFHGRVPESEYARMRAPFQQGEFPAPVKYGYASVGVVEAGDAHLQGQTVFCLHPHQDSYNVPAESVRPLPKGLAPERAVLAANMETAINGFWDAEVTLGERVTVVGAGVVGSLVAYLCSQLPGVEVQLVDINAKRALFAQRFAMHFATPEHAKAEQDCIIHASGHPDGLACALELAGPEGRIVEMSWFGEQPVTLPLGGAFHSQRLTLRASQVGQLPTRMRPRWDYARRLDLALTLLQDERLDALISGESDFADLPHRAAEIFSAESGVLCHRVRY